MISHKHLTIISNSAVAYAVVQLFSRFSAIVRGKSASAAVRHSRKTSRRRTRKAVSARAVYSRDHSQRAGYSAQGRFDYPLVVMCALSVVHATGLMFLFDPMAGLYDISPVIDQDWGLHFHHLNSLQGFWRESRAVWGYNPLFMAGYPSNTIQDLSVKLFEFLALGFSFIALTPVQWFKIIAVAVNASVPWLMYCAGYNLFFEHDGIKKIAAPIAATMGTVYWWNSLPREMFFYGMIGFPLAAYMSVLGVALFYRVAKQQTASWHVLLGAIFLAVLILPLHVQSVIIFVPPLCAYLISRPKLLQRKLVLFSAGTAALAIIVNLVWLIPAIHHRADEVSAEIVGQLSLFVSNDPLTFLKDYLGVKGYWSFRPGFLEKGFRLSLLVLGGTATLKLFRRENKDVGILLIAGLVWLFLLTYGGSLVPAIKGWQPIRFKVPYDLFLALASSYMIARWLTSGTAKSAPHWVPTVIACGAVSFLLNLIQSEAQGRMLLRTRMRPEITAVVKWVQETPENGRVLFEESGDESGFVYEGIYLSSFLPHLTGRYLIGGPINLYNDRHHFAEYHSGRLFKRDIRTLSDEEIKDYLRRYNIGAIVAFDPSSVRRWQALPGLVAFDERSGPIHMFRVNQPLSWLFVGHGQIQARLNRLELFDVRGKEIVLKYHWAEGMVGSPRLNIVPFKIGDDPIPFIKIIDPPERFTLRLD